MIVYTFITISNLLTKLRRSESKLSFNFVFFVINFFHASEPADV